VGEGKAVSEAHKKVSVARAADTFAYGTTEGLGGLLFGGFGLLGFLDFLTLAVVSLSHDTNSLWLTTGSRLTGNGDNSVTRVNIIGQCGLIFNRKICIL